MKKLTRSVLSILATMFWSTIDLPAHSITLIWDANTEPDLAGYRLYYGALDSAEVMIDVGLSTSVPVVDLAAGGIYHFYVTAYNTVGLESGPSEQVSYSVPALPISDSDGDGLPDPFELAHGLNPLDPGDASADWDGDGLSNLQEFVAGTDPGNLKSTLQLSLFIPQNGGMGIQFPSVTGQLYMLEANDDFPDGDWFPLLGNIGGNGGMIQEVDSTWNVSMRRMYRVTTAAKIEPGALPQIPPGIEP